MPSPAAPQAGVEHLLGGVTGALLALPIADQLYGPEQTQAATLTNQRVAGLQGAQGLGHEGLIGLHLGQQLVATDDVQGGQRRRAAQRALLMGVVAQGGLRGLIEAITGDHGREGHYASAESLAQTDDVRRDAKVLHAEPAAGAAQSVGDLVGDQQHPMAIADLADALPIGFGGDLHIGIADGLGDKGAYATLLFNHIFQVIGIVQILAFAAIPHASVAGRWRNALHAGQQRAHALTKAGFATDRDGIEGGAVKGVPERDHLVIAGDKAGQLQRHANGRRATGGKQHPVEIVGGQLCQRPGALDRQGMGEAARGKGQGSELGRDGGHYLGMTVAQLMNVVAVKVQIFPSGQIGQGAAAGAGQGIQTGGGESLMQKVAAILGKAIAGGRILLLGLPGGPLGSQVDIPLAVTAAAALAVTLPHSACHAG